MFLNWSKFNTPYRERYIKNKVPTVAGIYVLYVLMENNKWDCFYIGNAENLHETMMKHLESENDSEIQENLNDYICGFEYAQLDDEEERAAALKYLFDKLKPACMEDPGGKGKRVNYARSW